MLISSVHVGHPPKEWEGWESHRVHFHNFKILPSGKNEFETSSKFVSFGHEWEVRIYPGGNSKAKEGNISLSLHHFSEGDLSVQFHLSIMNKAGCSTEHIKFSPIGNTAWGWHDFAERDVIAHTDVLNNGTLTVDVQMMPEEGDGRFGHMFLHPAG